MVTYKRKGYVKKSGTSVKSAVVHTRGSGRSRGRKTGGRYSEETPWITKEGKLGGPGFLSKSIASQKKLLDKCIKKYGYRSCLGSIMVLNRSKTIRLKYGKKLDSLKQYLKSKYGGKGSFKARKSKRKARKSKRKARKSARKSKRKARKSARKARKSKRKARKSKRKARKSARKARKSKRKAG